MAVAISREPLIAFLPEKLSGCPLPLAIAIELSQSLGDRSSLDNFNGLLPKGLNRRRVREPQYSQDELKSI